FLVAGDPSGGRDDPTTRAWIVAGVVIGLVSAGLVIGARGRSPEVRAAMLGSTTGILFGATAALTKALGELVSDDGFTAIFTAWHLYALLVVGYLGTAINQASLQTGALAAAIATQTALMPITSIALGVLAFDESLHGSSAGTIGVVASLVLMIAGLFYLANAEQQDAKKVELPGS
nr:DMT family transporter [Thermoleophilaceae bacterium]